MRFLWVDEHIYTLITLMLFKYIITMCYIWSVCVPTVMIVLYICITIPDKRERVCPRN